MENFRARILRGDFRTKNETNQATVAKTAINTFGVRNIFDVTIRPLSSFGFRAERDTGLLIMPLFGGVDVMEADFLGINFFQVFEQPGGEELTLENPYDDYAVQLLVIEFASRLESRRGELSLAARNAFTLFHDQRNAAFSCGVFDSRAKSVYLARRPESKLLVYVIGGAFEFEDRLIETRDALLLDGASEVSFEALSQDAIALLFDFG